MPGLVDTHAHLLARHLPDLHTEMGDARWPRLEVDDSGDHGWIMRGAEVFRRVRRELWDAGARLEELAGEDIPLQIVSPVPVTLVDWARPQAALRFLAHQNDGIAEAVRASGGRLAGLGAVPLQDIDLAVAEMRRCTGDLGLVGIEIGTLNAGAELGDPSLRPFLAAAAEAGVPLFVHPVDGAGATRCSRPMETFAIGMLTDTAISVASLVFGPVPRLAELPSLRLCLSHGGGAFAWLYPRLRMWATTIGVDGYRADPSALDALVRRFYVDTLVFDPAHLPLVSSRFGDDHVVFGSDHPFIPSKQARASLAGGVDGGVDGGVAGGNAAAFYGVRPP